MKFDENSVILVSKNVVPLSNRLYDLFSKKFVWNILQLEVFLVLLFNEFCWFVFYLYICFTYVFVNKLFSFFLKTYTILFFHQLMVNVNFEKINTLADESIYNYVYLNRFFFGRKSYIVKYNYIFNMNKYYYTFIMSFKAKKQAIFFPISFVLNDILNYISSDYFLLKEQKTTLNILINDMNIFTEKKTNLVFSH